MTVECKFDGARLDAVVQLRRRTVIVDVLHLGSGNRGLLQRQPDGARRLLATLLQADAMIRLARGAVACHLPVDMRSARTRLLHLLQYEEPRALGDHKAVAIARERPRGALRLMIPTRAHDAHELKAA